MVLILCSVLGVDVAFATGTASEEEAITQTVRIGEDLGIRFSPPSPKENSPGVPISLNLNSILTKGGKKEVILSYEKDRSGGGGSYSTRAGYSTQYNLVEGDSVIFSVRYYTRYHTIRNMYSDETSYLLKLTVVEIGNTTMTVRLQKMFE